MELTKNSWHYKFYTANFLYSPSENFCDYFWNLVLAILLLVFTFPVLIIQLFIGESGLTFPKKIIVGVFMEFVLTAISFIIIFIDWGAVIVPLLIVCGVIIVFTGLIILWNYLFKAFKYSKFKVQVKETVSIPITAWKSFKGSYRPKIKWK